MHNGAIEAIYSAISNGDRPSNGIRHLLNIVDMEELTTEELVAKIEKTAATNNGLSRGSNNFSTSLYHHILTTVKRADYL